MARQSPKRKPVRRPGLKDAARALDCTFSHLRRVVIGERKSRSLLKRYRAWKKQQRELRATIVASVDDQVGIVNEFNAMRRSQPATNQNGRVEKKEASSLSCLPRRNAAEAGSPAGRANIRNPDLNSQAAGKITPTSPLKS